MCHILCNTSSNRLILHGDVKTFLTSSAEGTTENRKGVARNVLQNIDMSEDSAFQQVTSQKEKKKKQLRTPSKPGVAAEPGRYFGFHHAAMFTIRKSS